MENPFSDIIANTFELAKQSPEYIKAYEKKQERIEYVRYIHKYLGKFMDEFDMAGLDYTAEEKNEIIRWCNKHDYPIDKMISILAYKNYEQINKQYLIELKYKKVRDNFNNMFKKMIYNIYSENELYVLTKLIKCDILYSRSKT